MKHILTGWQGRKLCSSPYDCKVGEKFGTWINQAERTCTVLLNTGNTVLAEYTMPQGTSALHLYQQDKGFRSVSYRNLPLSILHLLVDGEVQWVGKPQGRSKPVGTPAELLAARKKKK